MRKAEMMEKVLELAKLGSTEEEICEQLRITDRTIRRYKQENKEISNLLSYNNNLINKVTKELTRLATGYTKEVEDYEKIKSEIIKPNGVVEKKEELVKTIKTVKVPGDVQAIKYILNNRRRDMWKDNPHKVEIDNRNIKLKEKEIESKIIPI